LWHQGVVRINHCIRISKVFFWGRTTIQQRAPTSYHHQKSTHEKKNDRMKAMLVGGFNLSEKYEFVSWNDDIPIWKNVPNHQPE